MAKRPSRRKASKMQPAVETLTFDLGNVQIASTDPGNQMGRSTYYIDLSQCASLVNRRFYRQGLLWATSAMRITSIPVAPGTDQPQSGSPSGAVVVSKLPSTWVMSNAWEKGFRAWQKMNNEALAEAESVKPKFLDFKIFADEGHHAYGVGANKLPVVFDYDQSGAPGLQNLTFTPATAGEWEMSKFVIPKVYDQVTGDPLNSVNNFEIVAVGTNYPGSGASGLQAVSLIEGYAASRALPDVVDPNVPDDAYDASGPTPENWQSALFNEGTTQDDGVLTDMATENNLAPYPFENDGVNTDTMYPGGANQAPSLQIHDISTISGTTVGGITHLKGGNFPCGLIRIDWANTGDVSANLALQIDLVPGYHRGYLCEPMTEM